MPGSGKSTVGRHLARRIDRPFFDSDHLIQERVGCSVREYFDREGEAAFRTLEAAAVRKALDSQPYAVSTASASKARTASLAEAAIP